MLHPGTTGHFEAEPPSGRISSVRPSAGVRVEDVGPIRHVILDRRNHKNALTATMYTALTATLTEAATLDRISVVLLSSAGGAFCIGNDLTEFLSGVAREAEAEGFVAAAGAFFYAMASFPKPLVAAVNGLALGAGATMLLHCDIVVASQFAAFQYPSPKHGIVPDGAATLLLPMRVGVQQASEWLLLGERIDAEAAHRFGLVNAITPLTELAAVALARAEALAKLPAGAVLETKRLLREPLRAAVDEAIARELVALTHRLASSELKAATMPPSSRYSTPPPPPSRAR